MTATWIVLMDPLAIAFASSVASIALIVYFMVRSRVRRPSPVQAPPKDPPGPPAMTLAHVKMEGFQVLEVYFRTENPPNELSGGERVKSQPVCMAKIRHPETGEVRLVTIRAPRRHWK